MTTPEFPHTTYQSIKAAAARVRGHDGGIKWDAFAAHLEATADALHDCERAMEHGFGYSLAEKAIDRVVTGEEMVAAAMSEARKAHEALGDVLERYGGAGQREVRERRLRVVRDDSTIS